jgi:hypothetical protein
MIGAELPGCLLAYLLRRLRILRHGSQARWQGLRLGLLAVVPNGHAQAERRDCGDATVMMMRFKLIPRNQPTNVACSGATVRS